MSCKNCIKVPAASPNESNLVIPHGEDWVFKDGFKDGDSYYNVDNATFKMVLKESKYDADSAAINTFYDSNFTRDKSDEGVAAAIAFNNQIRLTIHWDVEIKSLDKDVDYWYYIQITDPTLGVDKIYDRGHVQFSSE